MFKGKNVCGAGLAACSILMMTVPCEAGIIPSFQGWGILQEAVSGRKTR